jgi:hypothetical protein
MTENRPWFNVRTTTWFMDSCTVTHGHIVGTTSVNQYASFVQKISLHLLYISIQTNILSREETQAMIQFYRLLLNSLLAAMVWSMSTTRWSVTFNLTARISLMKLFADIVRARMSSHVRMDSVFLTADVEI